MPNARREGQTLIGFQADEELVRLIESARKRTNRSLFIREALGSKLRDMGLPVTEDMIYGPDRASDSAHGRGVEPFTKFGNASVVTSLNEDSAPAKPLPPRRPVSYKDALKTKPRKLKRP